MATNRIEKIVGHLQPVATSTLSHELPSALSVDVESFFTYLEDDHLTLKRDLKQFLEDNSFELVSGLDRDEQRDRSYKWAEKIASFKAISVADIEQRPSRVMAFFETIGYFDHSTVTRLMLQYTLFGVSVLNSGDEKQLQLLPKIDSMEISGVFCLSEFGHESDFDRIETTALYNHNTKTFVIHTPNRRAEKFWCCNAVNHGKLAVVFARLVIGDEDRGIHTFLVPLRSDDGKTLPGIKIKDLGARKGLHGVDYGSISFENVSIPVSNLLDKNCNIDADGIYTCKFPTQRRHFAALLSGLLLGRMVATTMCISGLKVALAVAIRFAHIKKQFGPSQDDEMELITYISHQRRLIPVLASAYAFDLFNKYLALSLERQKESGLPIEFRPTCAGFKVLVSRYAVSEIQTCREVCGGQGFHDLFRISTLQNDVDNWITFEGDNIVVLNQQLVRFLLAEYEKQKGRGHFSGILSHMTKRNSRILHGNVMNNMWLKAAFEIREAQLLRELSKKLQFFKNEGVEPFDSWNQNLPLILRLATAYTERRVFSHFYATLQESPASMQDVLGQLCNLFGLQAVSNDLGWYVSNGVVSLDNARYFDEQLTFLCGNLAEVSLNLTEAFGIPKRCMPPDEEER